MPVQVYNPLLNALALRERIQRAALEQQELEFRKQQAEETRARQVRQDALSDLQIRLQLGTNENLEALPPGAKTRQVDAYIPENVRAAFPPLTGDTYPLQYPAQADISYGGQDYAIRSRQELEGDRLRQAAALANAQAMARVAETREKLAATGVPVDPALAAEMGLGSSVLPPDALDNFLTIRGRMLQEPAAPVKLPGRDIPYPPEVEAQRRRMQRQPAAASSGGGELSESQQRLRAKDKRDELAKLEAEEQKLMEEVVNLRQFATGYDTSGQKLEAAQAVTAKSKLVAKEARLRQIRQRKVQLGFSTPAEAGLSKPAGAVAPAQDASALVGRVVKLADGRTVTVKKVNPDGTFEY